MCSFVCYPSPKRNAYLLPSCIRSKASLMSFSGILCVTNSSTISFLSRYSCTSRGTLSTLLYPEVKRAYLALIKFAGCGLRCGCENKHLNKIAEVSVKQASWRAVSASAPFPADGLRGSILNRQFSDTKRPIINVAGAGKLTSQWQPSTKCCRISWNQLKFYL